MAATIRLSQQHSCSCVDGPRLARDHLACSAKVACSHVSGLLVQSGGTAGPDGVREPSPHHSNGIDVPMNSQVWLGCVGSTDCAITRHCSLASSRTWLSGLSRRGHALRPGTTGVGLPFFIFFKSTISFTKIVSAL